MILNNIQRLIQITEDNIFVQARNYGIGGIIDNWLTKLFSPSVTDNFKNLINNIEYAAYLFKIETITTSDNEEVLNRAIHQCRDNDGRCIINVFFNAINQILSLIIDKYVALLFYSQVPNLENISSFEELANIDVTKIPELSKFDRVIYDIYNSYINSIHQKNFNKFFFKMRGSTIEASFIKDKLNFLDNYTVNSINNKNGKRMSITQK